MKGSEQYETRNEIKQWTIWTNKNGTKTIELGLNDEKRQLLKIKDLIEFTNRTNDEKMLVEIENLYHYP